MELNKIERLLENTLTVKLVSRRERVTKYFASTDVASHLMQYKSIFGIFQRLLHWELKQELAA
jgi:hypothetical protein